MKTKLPEGHFDVLHPGQPPPGGPNHEGGAAPHRHDPGPLVDAGRGDFGRQHSGTEVKIPQKHAGDFSWVCQWVSERDSLGVQVKVAVCILQDLKSVARGGQKEKGKVKPARGRAPRAPLL